MSVRGFVERFCGDVVLVCLVTMLAVICLCMASQWLGLALLVGVYAALVLAVTP